MEITDDLISRQTAIEHMKKRLYETQLNSIIAEYPYYDEIADNMVDVWMNEVPSAQPKISRIEQELHGKTPEEQYEFLHWLLLKFGLAYTDSRFAVVEWLRGEKEDGRFNQQTSGN